MIMLKEVGVDPVPNYTRDIKQGIARWTLTFMFQILTHWRQNFLHVMSNFFNHSWTTMMAYVDLKLPMQMDMFYILAGRSNIIHSSLSFIVLRCNNQNVLL
jgi:hypothetical protein